MHSQTAGAAAFKLDSTLCTPPFDFANKCLVGEVPRVGSEHGGYTLRGTFIRQPVSGCIKWANFSKNASKKGQGSVMETSGELQWVEGACEGYPDNVIGNGSIRGRL